MRGNRLSPTEAYFKMKEGEDYPVKEVTEEELRQKLQDNGCRDPDMQIRLCRGLGSAVMIGDSKYTLVSDDSE